jgi:hypothetical protein
MAKKQGNCEHNVVENQTNSMKDRFYNEIQPKRKRRENTIKPLTNELKKRLIKEMDEARKKSGR